MFEVARGLFQGVDVFTFTSLRTERWLSRLGLSGGTYFDYAVLGGGTLVNPQWIQETRTAVELDVPLWALGTGVGSCGFTQPLEVDLTEWKPLLADFTDIGVRGPLSREKLVRLGIDRVEVIGDLALSWARDRAEMPADPPRVAVNVTMPVSLSEQAVGWRHFGELRALLSSLRKEGWEVVPVAMYKPDVPLLEELTKDMAPGGRGIKVTSSVGDFFRLVAPCTFTIAIRLHAAVLSCCVGVPPLMLGYRDKCLDFMRSVELEEWHVGLHTAEVGEVLERATALKEEAQGLRPVVLARALAWKDKTAEYVKRVQHSYLTERSRTSR